MRVQFSLASTQTLTQNNSWAMSHMAGESVPTELFIINSCGPAVTAPIRSEGSFVTFDNCMAQIIPNYAQI